MKIEEAPVIPAPVDPIEQLIDVDEVARRLGVSAATVWVMARDGRFFPPMNLGRIRRWRVRDLNRWVEERATKISAISASADNSTRRKKRSA